MNNLKKNMPNQTNYVDGFVLIVPKNRVEEYKKMAEDAAKVWKKHGALSYRECMLEDQKPEHVTFSFPIMTKAEKNETIWFSYIEYRSRKHRDEVNAKVMKEFEEKYGEDEHPDMPFDMKRMSYGGFEVIVKA